MRRIRKTIGILRDNSGETIVEVLVAFTLLSIIMVTFSQGIAFATRTEARANENRKNADLAMLDFQTRLASGQRDDSYAQITGVFNDRIKVESITVNVDGQPYTYAFYEMIK